MMSYQLLNEFLNSLSVLALLGVLLSRRRGKNALRALVEVEGSPSVSYQCVTYTKTPQQLHLYKQIIVGSLYIPCTVVCYIAHV